MSAGSGEALLEATPPATPPVAGAPRVAGLPTPLDALLAPPPTLPTVQLMNVELHAITEQRATEHILSELDAGRGGMLVTPNLDHLQRCVNDLSFAALVAEADLVVADGMPLVWAAKLQRTPLPARVAGSDLIWSLSEAAARRGRSVFLLGGDPGTAEKAARILSERYEHLRIAGTSCPPLGFERDEHEVAKIINTLAAARPDIVYVALGSPKQERLICRIRRTLPQAWWLGVGISFSFVSGDVKRAPRWMQKTGLEWIHRLIQEPRRLFKRYMIVGLPFAARLLATSAWRGLVGVPAITRSRRQNRVSAEALPAPLHEGACPGVVDSPPSISVQRHNSTLERLRAVVLLGGTVRPTPLHLAVKRSILDLPLEQDTTILNDWLTRAAELAKHAQLDRLPVRILVNQQAFEPTSGAARHGGTYTVERDASEYRGTGGMLRDLAQQYDDDDLILVASASQVLLNPLAALAQALHHKGGDVNLISHRDGTPSGLMLIRCKTLRLIPAIGFFDMKEQALPLIAEKFDVRVLDCRRPTGLPLRTLENYIRALRHHHQHRAGRPRPVDPLAEDWSPSFAIVENGASVASKAHLHDTVVLRGAIVEAGASLVRCVVCPGAVVRQKSTEIDRFVTP